MSNCIGNTFAKHGGKARFGDAVGPEVHPTHVVVVDDGKPHGGGEPWNKPVSKPQSDGTAFQYYQHGVIYSSKPGNCHAVSGPIFEKWKGTDLGWPLGDEIDGGTAVYQQFPGGVIVCYKGSDFLGLHVAPNCHVLLGPIADRWILLGGHKSVIGFPVTDEQVTPDGIGRYNHFHNGSIYWKPTTGAHEVHGLVRAFWSSQGWERSSLYGYPISEETVALSSGNRFSDFEDGMIIWIPPDKEAVDAAPLSLTVGGIALPLTSDAVLQRLSDALTNIVNNLPPDPNNHILGGTMTSAPVFRSGLVTDYACVTTPPAWTGSVHNRRYMISCDFDVKLSVVPDIHVHLDADIEIFFNKSVGSKGAVLARIFEFWRTVQLPFVTSVFESAQQAGNVLDAKIKGIPPILLHDFSNDPGHILSVKTMRDGTLNIYASFP